RPRRGGAAVARGAHRATHADPRAPRRANTPTSAPPPPPPPARRGPPSQSGGFIGVGTPAPPAVPGRPGRRRPVVGPLARAAGHAEPQRHPVRLLPGGPRGGPAAARLGRRGR